jgi:hypothetical protein
MGRQGFVPAACRVAELNPCPLIRSGPLLRLVASVLVEAHDKWQVCDKRYHSETTLALLHSTESSGDQSIAVPAAITA